MFRACIRIIGAPFEGLFLSTFEKLLKFLRWIFCGAGCCLARPCSSEKGEMCKLLKQGEPCKTPGIRRDYKEIMWGPC